MCTNLHVHAHMYTVHEQCVSLYSIVIYMYMYNIMMHMYTAYNNIILYYNCVFLRAITMLLSLAVKPYFSHGGSTVHRFPGFAQGYAGGKRVEIKSTPSRVCRQFMMRKFDEVCRLVLKHKNSRNPLIQQTLLILLPRIAALNQELFALK